MFKKSISAKSWWFEIMTLVLVINRCLKRIVSLSITVIWIKHTTKMTQSQTEKVFFLLLSTKLYYLIPTCNLNLIALQTWIYTFRKSFCQQLNAFRNSSIFLFYFVQFNILPLTIYVYLTRKQNFLYIPANKITLLKKKCLKHIQIINYLRRMPFIINYIFYYDIVLWGKHIQKCISIRFNRVHKIISTENVSIHIWRHHSVIPFDTWYMFAHHVNLNI